MVGGNAIIVTDEMGTLRVFNYPCDSGSGNGYLQCYTDHSNYINQCVVSSDERYLITSSEVDRCIFIWKIHKRSANNENGSPDEQGANTNDDGRA
jgi:WD40 repeat protein